MFAWVVSCIYTGLSLQLSNYKGKSHTSTSVDIVTLIQQTVIDLEAELAETTVERWSSQDQSCSWQLKHIYNLLSDITRLTQPNPAETDDLFTGIVAPQNRVLHFIDELVTKLKERLSQDEMTPFLSLRDECEALYESSNICMRANTSSGYGAASTAGCSDTKGLNSAILETFKEGSLSGNIAADLKTLSEGAERLASICGPEPAKYYKNPLKGLHSIDSFKKAFNQAYPQHPITPWDSDMQLQCPLSWSIRFEQTTDWSVVLTYETEGPITQGLDDLFNGPTVLDCGMWCQLLLWMMIRFLLGDDLFNKAFKYKKGKFAFTQSWGSSMNEDCTEGDLLHSFYDEPEPWHSKNLSKCQAPETFA
ncbi:hypothetical protein RAB80_017726 [Fusarium oxysporum f. sp. vasinfectum]|nr:hypothetical protein RAB80_017726 [Fusarium oxysporum f. sp. vasinfectum]